MKNLKRLILKIPFAREIRNQFRRKSEAERIDQRDMIYLRELLEQTFSDNSNAVDVGAHSGDVLAEIVKLAPNGNHFAFEAIPSLSSQIRAKFPKVTVGCVAIAYQIGEIEFY